MYSPQTSQAPSRTQPRLQEFGSCTFTRTTGEQADRWVGEASRWGVARFRCSHLSQAGKWRSGGTYQPPLPLSRAGERRSGWHLPAASPPSHDSGSGVQVGTHQQPPLPPLTTRGAAFRLALTSRLSPLSRFGERRSGRHSPAASSPLSRVVSWLPPLSSREFGDWRRRLGTTPPFRTLSHHEFGDWRSGVVAYHRSPTPDRSRTTPGLLRARRQPRTTARWAADNLPAIDPTGARRVPWRAP